MCCYQVKRSIPKLDFLDHSQESHILLSACLNPPNLRSILAASFFMASDHQDTSLLYSLIRWAIYWQWMARGSVCPPDSPRCSAGPDKMMEEARGERGLEWVHLGSKGASQIPSLIFQHTLCLLGLFQ